LSVRHGIEVGDNVTTLRVYFYNKIELYKITYTGPMNLFKLYYWGVPTTFIGCMYQFYRQRLNLNTQYTYTKPYIKTPILDCIGISGIISLGWPILIPHELYIYYREGLYKPDRPETLLRKCRSLLEITGSNPGTMKRKRRSLLEIKKLNQEARLPLRKTAGSAGYDLYSLKSGTIESHSRLLIQTGIAIKLPADTYGRIASRSGLSVKKGIEVGAGVIDEDYRGPLGVVLYNFDNKPFEFDKHTRIAQLIIVPVLTPEIEEVSKFIDEKKNERGDKGFGSSGI